MGVWISQWKGRCPPGGVGLGKFSAAVSKVRLINSNRSVVIGHLEPAFTDMYSALCVKFLFKLVNYCNSYARKQKIFCFLNTVYTGLLWWLSYQTTVCGNKWDHSSKKICTQLANFQAVLCPRSVPSVSWYSAHSLKYYIISWRSNSDLYKLWPPHHHNRFTALFPGPPGWASAIRELLAFIVQRKVNRGRHTDHPAGRHSIRTNHCPPPPSPHSFFTGRMPFLSPNQCQSTESN